ncbi:MAG: crotonase/enoyl-CoA hydratase family protein [Dehalococcoidia bacterium]|nr:crotonase/enoyl-CoA hydratase family protein [Dehalococcoidia bacterium]
MTYRYLVYEKKTAVAHITLDRPEKLNALSKALQDELMAAVERADDDDDVRVIVLKGNGRAFSAGYDITPGTRTPGEYGGQNIRKDIKGLRRLQERWSALWSVGKPIIAQVHGYCLAGATDLVLHCDLIVAAEDASIGYPAVRALGSPPTHMWTYLVGPQWAKYLLLTGNSIDGRTAERIGLAWKAVPAAELDAVVDELAETLAKVPLDLLAANKAICNRAVDFMGRALVEQLAAENDAIAHQSPVVAEFYRLAEQRGLKAALEKRDAPFRDSSATKPKTS